MSSVVQSTPFSVPPASLEAITGRTSVIRLRESFDLGLPHSKHIQDSNHDRAFATTSKGGKLKLHSPLDENVNIEREAWQCMGVLEEHPAEDCSRALPQRLLAHRRTSGSNSKQGDHEESPTQHLDGVSSSIASGEASDDERALTSALAHLLDGTSPESQTARKVQRKGKRGLAELLQQRKATKSIEGSRGPQLSVTDEDSPSKASLFCSRLPQFRRESGPSTAMKDKISIFEGLAARENDRNQLNGTSGASNESRCRLPSKYRGAHRNIDKGHGPSANVLSNSNSIKSEASAAAGESSKELRTGRRESGFGIRQRTGETDQQSFFRRVSSTFKHRHKPSQQYPSASRSSRADGGGEDERNQNSSQGSQSTHQGQRLILSEKRQMLATESLRKRLETELRSAPDMNGHQDVQAGPVQAEQPHRREQQHGPLPVSQSHQESESHPIVYNRRKTTLWDIDNPFDVPKTKSRSKSDAAGSRLRNTGEGLPGQKESANLSNVALALITSTQDRPGTVGRDSDTSDSSDLVVIANADCDLTHPRPSRSSDKNMINVFCKCGREMGEEHESSEESTSSFYTAPVSTSEN